MITITLSASYVPHCKTLNQKESLTFILLYTLTYVKAIYIYFLLAACQTKLENLNTTLTFLENLSIPFRGRMTKKSHPCTEI